nr:glutathione peroxidase [Rubripirellula tenax]
MAVADKHEGEHECALNFKVKTIDGETVDLEDYEGNVVLVVNVASKCGLTPQYAGLQKLYEAHKEDGLVVLGFPCNQFGGQEPGTDAEVKTFCSTKYNVSFPMFSKVDVNGDAAAPIYKYLTSKTVEPVGDGKVSWNFEKFLIDRDGNLVHRFSPRTAPDDEALIAAIKEQLAKK